MLELEYLLRVEVAKRDQPRDMCSFFSKKKKGPLLILLGQVVEMRSHVRRSTTPQTFGFLYLKDQYNAQHERGSGEYLKISSLSDFWRLEHFVEAHIVKAH